MLRDVYAPTSYESVNQDPGLSACQKLEIIKDSPVLIEDDGIIIRASLPFVKGARILRAEDLISRHKKYLHVLKVDIGDKELYRNGIGTRLLQAGVYYELLRNPRLDTVRVSSAQLGVVNTMVEIFGLENIAVTMVGKRYGMGQEQPLEAFLDDYPPVQGQPYWVRGIEARLNPESMEGWETPSLLCEITAQ
jgi:hypothetical protein